MIAKRFKLFSKILVPTDFSPASWKAVKVGLKISDEYDSSISIIHIYPLAHDLPLIEGNEEMTSKLQRVQKDMINISDDLSKSHKATPKNHVVAGNISKRLREFTSDRQYDLIIIGVNSNGDDNELGSHASELIEVSRSPVLVIPNDYELDD